MRYLLPDVTWLWKCFVLSPFWLVATQAEWGQGDPFGYRPISLLQDFDITAHNSCCGAVKIGARMQEKKCILGCLSDAIVLGVTTHCWCNLEFMRRKEHRGKIRPTLTLENSLVDLHCVVRPPLLWYVTFSHCNTVWQVFIGLDGQILALLPVIYSR